MLHSEPRNTKNDIFTHKKLQKEQPENRAAEGGTGGSVRRRFLSALCGKRRAAHLLIEPNDLVHLVVVLEKLPQLAGAQRPVTVRTAAGRGHFRSVRSRPRASRFGGGYSPHGGCVSFTLECSAIGSTPHVAIQRPQSPTITVDRRTSCHRLQNKRAS